MLVVEVTIILVEVIICYYSNKSYYNISRSYYMLVAKIIVCYNSKRSYYML
jgi:hypothetical protein